MQHGAQVIGSENIQDANFAIIITCGFNDYAVTTGGRLVDYARTFMDDSHILIMGCIPGTAPESIASTELHMVAPRAYAHLDQILAQMGILKEDGAHFVDMNIGQLGLAHEYATLSPSTFYISVSNGCAGNCTYCEIRHAIGKIQSRPLETIQTHIDQALADGAGAVYLGSDDLGAWGIDRGEKFPALLEAALASCGRAGAEQYVDLRNVINPVWLVKYEDELENLFSKHAARLPALSVALQSGSPKVLRWCQRYAHTERMQHAVQTLQKANPSLYSFGHLIIGLPPEGPGELEQTLRFMDESAIDFWTCFRYSSASKDDIDERTRIEANWASFIHQAGQQGYMVQEKPDRVYAARKLDPRFNTIEFPDAAQEHQSQEEMHDH